MKNALLLLLLFSIFFLNGCHVTNSFYLQNQVGSNIAVTSGHTGKTLNISKNRTKEIFHAKGPVSIQNINGGSWNYDLISVLDVKDDKYRYHSYRFFSPKISIYLIINKNGEICILQVNDKKANKCPEAQPYYYPLKPTTKE